MQAHLPEEQNSFVGRERELEELSRLVRVTRVLTLCGPGGVGKTRLALRLLASVAPGFRDGVWFVELVRCQNCAIALTCNAAARRYPPADRRGAPAIRRPCSRIGSWRTPAKSRNVSVTRVGFRQRFPPRN
jgi:hypothetical protein